jgi:hypothetical protein
VKIRFQNLPFKCNLQALQRVCELGLAHAVIVLHGDITALDVGELRAAAAALDADATTAGHRGVTKKDGGGGGGGGNGGGGGDADEGGFDVACVLLGTAAHLLAGMYSYRIQLPIIARRKYLVSTLEKPDVISWFHQILLSQMGTLVPLLPAGE